MNRAHPVFSRAGCLGGVVLVMGVLIALAVSGGALFSPGELTAFADDAVPAQPVASHAEIGNDCRQCHAPFVGISAQRCEACHDRVAQQRASGEGLHGSLSAPVAARCADCHSDHHGRDFDPSADALLRFDHDVGFSLARHVADYQGQPMRCQGCHLQADFQFEPAACVACHTQANASFMADHAGAFGTGCLACHDGVDATSAFDHAQTGFALDAHHAELTCAACHRPAVPPAETPNQCASCHQEPPIHAGLFGTDCAACHTTAAWLPAQMPNHRFPLDHGDEGLIACATCHMQTFAAYTCTNCHEHEPEDIREEHEDEGIVGERLLDCASCHPNGEKD